MPRAALDSAVPSPYGGGVVPTRHAKLRDNPFCAFCVLCGSPGSGYFAVMYPSWVRSSAVRTAPPAAPRTVLCERATNR